MPTTWQETGDSHTPLWGWDWTCRCEGTQQCLKGQPDTLSKDLETPGLFISKSVKKIGWLKFRPWLGPRRGVWKEMLSEASGQNDAGSGTRCTHRHGRWGLSPSLHTLLHQPQCTAAEIPKRHCTLYPPLTKRRKSEAETGLC